MYISQSLYRNKTNVSLIYKSVVFSVFFVLHVYVFLVLLGRSERGQEQLHGSGADCCIC